MLEIENFVRLRLKKACALKKVQSFCSRPPKFSINTFSTKAGKLSKRCAIKNDPPKKTMHFLPSYLNRLNTLRINSGQKPCS